MLLPPDPAEPWGNPYHPAASAVSSVMSVWTGCPSPWTQRARSTVSGITTSKEGRRGKSRSCQPRRQQPCRVEGGGAGVSAGCLRCPQCSQRAAVWRGADPGLWISGCVSDRNWLKSYVYRENRTKKPPILGFLARPLEESAKLWHQPYQTSIGTDSGLASAAPVCLRLHQAPWGLNRQISLHPQWVRRP